LSRAVLASPLSDAASDVRCGDHARRRGVDALGVELVRSAPPTPGKNCFAAANVNGELEIAVRLGEPGGTRVRRSYRGLREVPILGE
jgi:hypothetical protein